MSDLSDDGIPCMWMRGGTSKGGYFLASDLPDDPAKRDAVLLSIMGSPDPRQIDGMGGGDPLTSKVAVIHPSTRPDADVDYLFLQVFVDRALVSDTQNCGNILAGVGPFAIERGLVPAQDGETMVRIHMENTGQIAQARIQTPNRHVTYHGSATIDGVPGNAAPVAIGFQDGSEDALPFPSGNSTDTIDGINVTLIDNGMPCILILAADLGLTGQEDPMQLEANSDLVTKLESIRLKAGPMMGLGDVTNASVPKMTLLSAPQNGGAIATRSFIPHRCHKAIGVLATVSVATACLHKGTIAHSFAQIPTGTTRAIPVEHPSGATTILCHLNAGKITQTEVLRTARKLMDGVIFSATV